MGKRNILKSQQDPNEINPLDEESIYKDSAMDRFVMVIVLIVFLALAIIGFYGIYNIHP